MQVLAHDVQELNEMIDQQPALLLDGNWLIDQLGLLSMQDKPQALECLLEMLAARRTTNDLRTLANTRVLKEKTVLMLSTAQGHSHAVTILLDLGADPDMAGPGGWTALDFAADAGHFTICQQLLRAGADASISEVFKRVFSNENEYAGEMTQAAIEAVERQPAVDPAKLTPLGRAAYEGNLGEVEALLSGGSSRSAAVPGGGRDPEEGAEMGHTPLTLASMRGHVPIMDALLRNGANVNATNKFGWTPLMLAARRGDADCLGALLARGADANHLSPDRWTALAETTIRGDVRLMRLLLEMGADPELRSQHDWTPLMHAAYRGDVDAVNLLLEAGASFEDISARDETVLLLAAAAGSAVVVRRLLAAGCAPESEWSRRSPVDVSTAAENTEGAGSSSSGGGSRVTNPQHRIERVFTVGWTPLMVACQVGSLEIVQMLLDAGANHEPKSPLFKTALEIAREQGRADIVNYFVEKLGDP